MMIILMMTKVIVMCFLHPKGPQTRLEPGGQKNYDNYNDNDG